ncbi:MAG: DUF4440 domain-containing protein [Proteobacteria bacterium]|nr:DUF4440 domain-containing protein [Pseudomonadota bacterium]
MTASTLTIAQASRMIAAREPIFHHPELGTSRAAFEAMVDQDFWEVGASGAKYSKAFVLDTLQARHAEPVVETFTVSDFACRELAPNLYLATYQLDQAGRLSRRSTIWRFAGSAWKIVYHQGTLMAA